MDIERIAQAVKAALPDIDIRKDEDMSRHCSFRTGGPAELWISPSMEEIQLLFAVLRGMGIAPTVLGRGSNVLIGDRGIPGVTVQIGEAMADIRVEGESITASAGASLASIAQAAMEAGLGGMEFAHGIPGSLGGAVMMNAGAYGGEMKDIVASVSYMDAGGEIHERTDCAFAYRTSCFEGSGELILSAVLKLSPADRETVLGRMLELREKRSGSQPLDKPSAGSTFKRPAVGYAAAMIDAAGLKGLRVGGAVVSPKHAGFVVNDGGATSADVRELMAEIQKRVFADTGVMLEPEVRFTGLF